MVSAAVSREAWDNSSSPVSESDVLWMTAGLGCVKQITTGTLCHLEAAMVENALEEWDLNDLDFLFIENVGNLVCPSSYDLGENLRLVLISVTEARISRSTTRRYAIVRTWQSSRTWTWRKRLSSIGIPRTATSRRYVQACRS